MLPGLGREYMKLELHANRQLRLAFFLSVFLHAGLFLPWPHGHWLGQHEDYSDGAGSLAKLEVRLMPISMAPSTGGEPHLIAAVQAGQAENSSASTASSSHELSETRASPEKNRTGIPLDMLYYYPGTELDIRPNIKREPILDEHPEGMTLAVNGRALFELLIERNGQINAVNLLRNDLPASHVRQLEQAFSRVEYVPGRKSGMAVRSRLLIEVIYVDGVLHHLPQAQVNLGVFPAAPDPHVPITLPADRHKRKSNPPLN